MSLPPAVQLAELSQEEQLFTALCDRLVLASRLPLATYRLQFHAAFTFAQAREIVPYLQRLGISTCYASPYLRARSGSTHGYDTVDYQALNPEVGSAAEYEALVRTLQAHGMGQILDIVPNHMGFSTDNVWWMDVLRHGPSSPYATFFDIDWQPPHGAWSDKVILPVLPEPYGQVLDNRQMQLLYRDGDFWVDYAGMHLPVEPCSTLLILRPCLALLHQQLPETHAHLLELYSIVTALEHLPPPTTRDPERCAERHRESTIIRQRLLALQAACPPLQDALAETLQQLNGCEGDAASFDTLHAVLEAQVYRLSYWRTAGDVLNYRRFFDITDLLAVRMEDPVVFDAAHARILHLLEDGSLTGVRIDHPDGLADPSGYFQRLQRAYVQRHCRRLLAEYPEPLDTPAAVLEDKLLARFDALEVQQRTPLYMVVEKILMPGERLPVSWPVHGTTGYEFLNQLNGIFVDRRRWRSFRSLYAAFIGKRETFADVLYEAKRFFLTTRLRSELDTIGALLNRLAATSRRWRDLNGPVIDAALREVLSCFPLYRTYTGPQATRVSATDRQALEVAFTEARRRHSAAPGEAFDYLHDVLHVHWIDATSPQSQGLQRLIIRKVQQLTGAAMAKGLEDTAGYRYTPLASLNEVGGDPGRFGASVFALHRANQARQQHWPQTLLATATHDTKRGEDVRARLNVLSEMPQTWRHSLKRWQQWNRPLKVQVDGHLAPSRQEEYLLYQTLLGAWPMEADFDQAVFLQRIQAYMLKALREAKVSTSWRYPNPAYEEAVAGFITDLLDATESPEFLADFRRLQEMVAQYGVWNSLSQTFLKLTAPGVPDIYQGTELWDFSLVDPDNRRPVDYALRQRLLDTLQQHCQEMPRLDFLQELLQGRMDGRIKLFVIWQTLQIRQRYQQVFQEGTYVPLRATGSQQDHLCAFARIHGDTELLVIAPRLFTRLLASPQEQPLGSSVWYDTRVLLPPSPREAWYRHLLTEEIILPVFREGQAVLPMATVCAHFPLALLQRIEG